MKVRWFLDEMKAELPSHLVVAYEGLSYRSPVFKVNYITSEFTTEQGMVNVSKAFVSLVKRAGIAAKFEGEPDFNNTRNTWWF